MAPRHDLFEHIQRIEQGRYVSVLDDIEYYLSLSNLGSQDIQINISYNDVRNYWENLDDRSFEKEAESIVYEKASGVILYRRLKEHVPSILVPSHKIHMDINPLVYDHPYPEPINQWLDKALRLFKSAQRQS